jgi:hypothetical protein
MALAEGEELSSNPLRRIFNGLQTTCIVVDVDQRIPTLLPLYGRSPAACKMAFDPDLWQGGNSNAVVPVTHRRHTRLRVHRSAAPAYLGTAGRHLCRQPNHER